MITDPPIKGHLSEQDKRDFCAVMLQKYGLQLSTNNEILPVLYVAYQSALVSQSTNEKNNEAVQKVIRDFRSNALEKITRLETKQVRFQNSKEAFWYSFGWLGLPLITITIVLCLCFLIYNYQREKIRYEDEKIKQLSYLVDHAVIRPKQINDTTSAYIINLFPSRQYKDARAGKNYVYNEECKCIEIPLFFCKKVNSKTLNRY